MLVQIGFRKIKIYRYLDEMTYALSSYIMVSSSMKLKFSKRGMLFMFRYILFARQLNLSVNFKHNKKNYDHTFFKTSQKFMIILFFLGFNYTFLEMIILKVHTVLLIYSCCDQFLLFVLTFFGMKYKLKC